MIASETRRLPLAAALWPSEEGNRLVRAAILVVAGSLLMTLSAKVQVPFWPVPMTMQTFAALAIGAVYGARLGFATVAIYLAQGAIGLPVFAGGGGAAYLMGPTGGYLIGFAVAAFAVGWLAERGWDRHVATAFLAFLAGEVIMYGMGMSWLATLVGPQQAIAAGMLPFLPAEAFKVALAMAVLPLAWRIVGRRAGQ